MKQIFNKYRNNNCTEHEFNTFKDIITNPENDAIVKKEMTNNWDELPIKGDTPDLSSTLHKIHYEINKLSPNTSKILQIGKYLTRIAAVLLIPLAVVFYLQSEKYHQLENTIQTISTPLASKTSFELPDGSTVWLNSGSTISYPKKFHKNVRSVKLTGEAYFDIKKKGEPFIVETSSFSVNVLGTAFNVLAYDNEIPAVTLDRGKVSLKTVSNFQQILLPGQQAIIDTLKHSVTLKNVQTNMYSSWINNQLIFNNETLSSVIKRLERWYNIQIDVADKTLLDKKVTASIEFESIREIMELMEITLAVKYEYNKELRKLTIKKSID